MGKVITHALSLMALLGLCTLPVLALEPLPGPGDALVVSDEVLAKQRGGFFDRNGGLQLSIGLEQATYLNGVPIHYSVLREMAPVTKGAGGLSAQASESVLIQAGLEGARLNGGFTEAGWHTAIQNDLDGQHIRHQTILHLELSGLEARHSELGRMLDRQLVESLGR